MVRFERKIVGGWYWYDDDLRLRGGPYQYRQEAVDGYSAEMLNRHVLKKFSMYQAALNRLQQEVAQLSEVASELTRDDVMPKKRVKR